MSGDKVQAAQRTAVKDYMRGRAAEHTRGDETDVNALAGDACAHFGLRAADQSIPEWLFTAADAVANEQREARGWAFVEKRLNYTEDGDVLFA